MTEYEQHQIIRSKIAAQARDLIARNALIIDTETTGLDEEDEIVEIAIVDAFDTIEFSALVRPSQAIPKQASDIHGITDEMAAFAESSAFVFHMIKQLVITRPLVAYNAAFDSRLIQQTDSETKILPAGSLKWHCVMQMWQDYHGLTRWQRLENVCRNIGAQPGGHRALGDAKAAREVLRWLARQEAA